MSLTEGLHPWFPMANSSPTTEFRPRSRGAPAWGIEAQQAAVERYLNGGNWKVVETLPLG